MFLADEHFSTVLVPTREYNFLCYLFKNDIKKYIKFLTSKLSGDDSMLFLDPTMSTDPNENSYPRGFWWHTNRANPDRDPAQLHHYVWVKEDVRIITDLLEFYK